MVDHAVRQTTAAAYPPVWHYSYPGIYESMYADEPCEGCRKKLPVVTYQQRWRCASCAKDVLAGVKTINRPEYPGDYYPEPRWRDVSPEAHLARRATYEQFCETWRLRLYEQAPDAPWLRTWDQPRGPVLCNDIPFCFPFLEWRVAQNPGWGYGGSVDDSCYWRNEPAQPVSHRPPLRMRIVVCHYPQPHTWHMIVAEPTYQLSDTLPQARKYWRFSYTGDFTEYAERVEYTNIGSRQGSAAWEGKRAVLQEVRARLAALDNTTKGRPYRWHRLGHSKTWRPWRLQATTSLWSDTPSQRTLRPERRPRSLGTVPPVALPVKPGPDWEANDGLDSEDGDPAPSVGETAASEASTRLGIWRFLQRQQPPVRQSRLLAPHSRRHAQLWPAEDTSRVRPSCRMLLTAALRTAFYCNRRPKRLLLERGCTDGTGPRPSVEP
jgi:hypothetical protein